MVMMMERVPKSLRGALSRWLLEPKTGVFLGNPSGRVRDELWEKAVKASKGKGTILQVWTANNPQGFSYRQFGETRRVFEDFEGLALIGVKGAVPDEPQNADTTEG